jgi:quercetin dioxygenase-like cupin family protein
MSIKRGVPMPRKRVEEFSSCEMAGPRRNMKKANRTALYRHKGNLTWQGVSNEPYKTEGDEWSNIVRKVLIGSRGESTKFHVRYFEIASGGCSSLERHRHEHVVICVRGEGIVQTEGKRSRMKFMDTLYISPYTVHRLSNPFEAPFGFLCIVNAKRDRPKIVEDKGKKKRGD